MAKRVSPNVSSLFKWCCTDLLWYLFYNFSPSAKRSLTNFFYTKKFEKKLCRSTPKHETEDFYWCGTVFIIFECFLLRFENRGIQIRKLIPWWFLDKIWKFFSFFESHLDYFDCCCCLLILATVTIYYCGGVITYYFLYWWWWSSVLPVCLTVKSLSYFQHPYRNQMECPWCIHRQTDYLVPKKYFYTYPTKKCFNICSVLYL